MNTLAIAAKLRELAELFEEATVHEPLPLKLAEALVSAAEHKVLAEEKPEALKLSGKMAECAPEASIDDVREALAKLIANDKRDKAVEVLTQHNVKKIGELVEAQFPSVVAACAAAM